MRFTRTRLWVSLLLLVALCLRLRGLQHMEFKRDELQALRLGMNLLADRPWATAAPWPRTGMLSSKGIANAPLFNHVVALFWALTHNPVGAALLVALTNWLCLPALYVWAKRTIGPTRALVFLALIAVSPFAVAYSRKLWAQDLLLPGLTVLLFGLARLRGATFWSGLGLALLGLLPVTQLHQSGPIFAVVLGLAVAIQCALDRRDGRLQTIPPRPDLRESALIAAGLGLHAFFVIPYLRYLLTLPPEVLVHPARLPMLSAEYLARLLLHAVPTDLLRFIEGDRSGFFHDRETTGRLGWLARNVGYYGAIATGAPLLAAGLWHWVRAPRTIPHLGLAWMIFVGAFIALRIPAEPHYVLILYPLPFLLMADGFALPSSAPRRLVDVWLPRLRWVHIALLLVLTCSYQSWLFARSGSPGDYGVAYSQRLAQADALLARIEARDWAPEPPLDASLRYRLIPEEVIFLADWRAGQPPAFPDTLRLREGWEPEDGGPRQYRWELVNLWPRHK